MDKSILHWSYRDFQEVPEVILDFEEVLEEIYLKENFIRTIPQWLLAMTKIRFIHLSGNSIKEIPEEIYLMENLEFLDVSMNRLKALPESIGKLRSLRRFNVSENEITSVPGSRNYHCTYSWSLGKYGVFTSHHILSPIPAATAAQAIGHLKELEVLDLSANLIRNLPNELGDCHELYEIVLNDNLHLKVLPEKLAMLPKLDTLCADRCGLLYLPALISDSLKHVRVFNNRFVTHIPMAFIKHVRGYYDIVHPICERPFLDPGYLRVIEKESNRKLLLPRNTRVVYDYRERRVFSLFNECLRTISSSVQRVLKQLSSEIPSTLHDYIENTPIAFCIWDNCRKPLLTEYYLVIVKRLKSSSSLIFSCNFCSTTCASNWLTKNAPDFYEVMWSEL